MSTTYADFKFVLVLNVHLFCASTAMVLHSSANPISDADHLIAYPMLYYNTLRESVQNHNTEDDRTRYLGEYS